MEYINFPVTKNTYQRYIAKNYGHYQWKSISSQLWYYLQMCDEHPSISVSVDILTPITRYKELVDFNVGFYIETVLKVERKKPWERIETFEFVPKPKLCKLSQVPMTDMFRTYEPPILKLTQADFKRLEKRFNELKQQEFSI